jgi:hypothetical protein
METKIDRRREREACPDEHAVYQLLCTQYYERFRPSCHAERCLVDDLIHCDWSIGRFQRLQLEDSTLSFDWQSLLASKHAAYWSILKTLRSFRTNPSPKPAPESLLKTSVH